MTKDIRQRPNFKAGVDIAGIEDVAQGIESAYGGATGCLASTYDRGVILGALTVGVASSGTARMYRIKLTKGMVINNITFWAGTTGGTNLTHCWFFICSQPDTGPIPLAKTVDDTSATWTSGTARTNAITGGWTVPSTGIYYVGIVITHSGGGIPNIEAAANMTTTGARTASPKPGGSSTTGLTDPASMSGSAQTTLGILGHVAYAELS